MLAIILFSSIASFGQNSGKTDRVIIKLKNEIADPGNSWSKQNLIGNNRIDITSVAS